VVQGHCDAAAGDAAELREAWEFFTALPRPLLFVRGTHEGRPGGPADAIYRDLFLTEVARTSGQVPATVTTNYALVVGGIRVIILDYTTFRPAGEAERLLVEQLALAERRGEQVVLCGHPPLIPVARPFFSRLDYAQGVLARLAASTAPTVYCCGHTHNQVASLHRLSGERWLPQLQSVPLGYPDRAPLPLQHVRGLLPPPEDLHYGWGYLEDSAPGWILAEVEAHGLRLRWRRLGQQEDGGEVYLGLDGRATFVHTPAEAPPVPPPAWPLQIGDARVRTVWLRAAGSASRAPHRLFLNDCAIGTLPRLEYFDARQGLAIPPACWPAITQQNVLRLEPVAEEERSHCGFVIEVTLANGSVARTRPLADIYTTSPKWDGWRWAAPSLRRVGQDEPLRLCLDFMGT